MIFRGLLLALHFAALPSFAGGSNPLELREIPASVCAIYLSPDSTEPSNFLCSATLIGPSTIASAAHCLKPILASGGEFEVACAEGTVVRKGKTIASSDDYWIHPEYDEDQVRMNEVGDSLLLQTAEPFPKDAVPPMLFPRDEAHFQRLFQGGGHCLSAGYGKEGAATEFPVHGYNVGKRTGNYRIVGTDPAPLAGIFFGYEGFWIESGDSGGTLACFDPESENWVLIGIHSWGLSDQEEIDESIRSGEVTSAASVLDGKLAGIFREWMSAKGVCQASKDETKTDAPSSCHPIY